METARVMAVSIVIICVWTAGCKKQTVVHAPVAPVENVITNRMNDAAYMDALRKNREGQTRKASEQLAVARQQQACRQRVQAALPAGADEAALSAALAKDAEWQSLSKKADDLQEEGRQIVISAREAIRKRMEDEVRAVKAVEAGTAKAVDKPLQAPQDGVKKTF
jgi:hypothetical protein